MKDNFDDILRKKWEQFHFEVDDQHRKDMIQLLDQPKRRKTGLFWWFSGIVSGLAIAILFISNRQPVTATNSSSLNPSPVHNTTHNDKAVNDANLPQASFEGTDPNGSSNTYDASTSEPAAPKMEMDNTTLPKQSEAKDNIQKNKIATPKSSKSKSHSIPNKEQASNSSRERSGFTGVTESNDPSLDNKITNTPVAATSSVSSEEETKHTVVNGIENSTANLNPADNAVLAPMRSESFVTDPVDALQIQSLSYSRDIPEGITPSSSFRKTFAVFAEAGAGIVPGMKTHFKTGWTVRGGGGFLFNVSPKNSLSLSSGYMMQDGGFDFDKTSTVQTNSFGLRSSFNSLSPDRLHFIYGRVGIHHSIRRHMISLFGGTQYLYGAQGEITVQTQDAIAGASEETSRAWLKLDGMTRWLWNTEIQYGYRITPRMAVHAGVKYYFTNIEATDPELQSKGFYWNGKMAQLNPFFTINYLLYERN